MTKQHFSYKEIFSFGWAKTKQHAWFIVLTEIIIGIIMSAVGDMRGANLLCTVVTLMTVLSVASVSLLIARDHHFSFSDLVSPLLSPKKVLRFFAITAIIAVPLIILGTAFVLGVYMHNPVVTVLGIILFFPLVYFSVCFKVYPYVVLEHENTPVIKLMTMTYNLTAPHFFQMLGFLVLATLLNILGALFVVGLLLTIPMTMFAMAHVYDKLKEHTA